MSTDIVNKFRSRSDVETQPGLSDAELGEIEGYIDVKIDAETRDLLKGFVFSYHPFGLVKWNLEDGGEDDYIIPYFYEAVSTLKCNTVHKAGDFPHEHLSGSVKVQAFAWPVIQCLCHASEV